jgi:hypothetical protein
VLAPLRDATTFARAAVGDYGVAVIWDDGEGVPRSPAGRGVHVKDRDLAGAARRRDRVHDEAAAERRARLKWDASEQ